MSALVELGYGGRHAPKSLRITLSRVPTIGEVVRILDDTEERGTTARLFHVISVTHVANTERYPKRENELDAWIYGTEYIGKDVL